jgi:hypothetical protein
MVRWIAAAAVGLVLGVVDYQTGRSWLTFAMLIASAVAFGGWAAKASPHGSFANGAALTFVVTLTGGAAHWLFLYFGSPFKRPSVFPGWGLAAVAAVLVAVAWGGLGGGVAWCFARLRGRNSELSSKALRDS